MIDYAAILALVNVTLPDYGTAVKFVSTSGINRDTDKPWKTDIDGTDEDIEYSTVGISVPPGSISEMGFKTSTVDALKNSERIFLVAPGTDGQDLETYSFLDANGIRSNIEVIDKLQPADVVLLYVVGVSR